jgi:hypothetical protein
MQPPPLFLYLLLKYTGILFSKVVAWLHKIRGGLTFCNESPFWPCNHATNATNATTQPMQPRIIIIIIVINEKKESYLSGFSFRGEKKEGLI